MPQRWAIRNTDAWVMYVKLHQVPPEKHKCLLGSARFGPWVKGVKAR